MQRKHTIPVARDDLVFSVDMALRKAERFWPKKRGPGDHDRLRPFAEMIVDKCCAQHLSTNVEQAVMES